MASEPPDRILIHDLNSNGLLAVIGEAEQGKLLPHFERVELTLGDVLHEAGEPIEHVYFPLSGVISLVTVLRDGVAVEAALAGREGMAGIQVFLGSANSTSRMVVQVPGEALRLGVPAFRQGLLDGGNLRLILGRYSAALFALLAQSAACNRAHPAEQRIARWLLMMHDGAGGDRFPLWGEVVSHILGPGSPGVAVALAELELAGLVDYRDNVLVVLSREGMEARSCECYRHIRTAFDGIRD